MKKIFAILAFPAALAACDGSAVEPGASGRYWLTSLFGKPLPAGATAPGLLCTDSIYSEYLELIEPATVKLGTEGSRTCVDGPRSRETTVRSGTYTTSGDTIRIRVEMSADVVGYMEFLVIRDADQLKRPFTAYVEADPGSAQVQYDIYRKR